MALTAWPLRVGGVKRALAATFRAGSTSSEWVEEITLRTLTEPVVESSTSKMTVPLFTPLLESEDGKDVDPWRSKRGVLSSSVVL